VALVVLDVPAIKALARKNKWELDDLTTDSRVSALLQSELEKYGQEFKGYERPKKMMLISEDFTMENGQLTPSLKVKRREVLRVYGAQLEALFGQK
jgi:long-chain acyl-CoA synthetase